MFKVVSFIKEKWNILLKILFLSCQFSPNKKMKFYLNLILLGLSMIAKGQTKSATNIISTTQTNTGDEILLEAETPDKKTKVFVAFAHETIDDVEIIDLLSSKTTCHNPENIPLGHYGASGGLGFKDKPLICGGNDQKSACHVYEDGTWKSSDSLKEGRWGFAMTKSPFQDGSSKLFLTGGWDESNEDLSSSEVLTEKGWQVSVPLPVKLRGHCMVTINSTSVMVIGGWQNEKRSGRSFLFNSETNIWTEGSTLIYARNVHSCGSIITNSKTQDKSIIVVGGIGEDLPSLRSVEVLDLASNGWRKGPDLPFDIFGTGMVEDPSGGVVLIGGFSSFGNGLHDTLYRLPHAGSDATWELLPQKLKRKSNHLIAFLIPDDIAACN